MVVFRKSRLNYSRNFSEVKRNFKQSASNQGCIEIRSTRWIHHNFVGACRTAYSDGIYRTVHELAFLDSELAAVPLDQCLFYAQRWQPRILQERGVCLPAPDDGGRGRE